MIVVDRLESSADSWLVGTGCRTINMMFCEIYVTNKRWFSYIIR
jgi:hypothetical protein